VAEEKSSSSRRTAKKSGARADPSAADVLPPAGLTYADAGVDVAAGDEAVRLIKEEVESTRIPGVLGGLGGFAALYEMPPDMKQPVLVTATDGVGTKLLIAQEVGKLNTVGVDLVAMCVNDVLTVGASPVLFLDYIATGKLDPAETVEVVKGIAKGCREAGCALVGGETAEMPGMYAPKHFDLAGFCVGLAEKEHLIDGSAVKEGDIVIGLASSGLHSNGYSLVRRVLEQNQCGMADKFPHFGETVGYTLLLPTRIYVSAVWSVIEKGVPIHGMAHITGGGILGNLARVIPDGLSARLHFENWKIPKVFQAIQHLGEIDETEMFRTFNMGVGYVMVVPFESAEYAAKLVQRAGEECMYLGSIVRGKQPVTLEGIL
jgi:phosphoribosylformylglycinamidine cyclo-ligase